MSLEVRVERESRVIRAVTLEAIRIGWLMQKSNTKSRGLMLRNICI